MSDPATMTLGEVFGEIAGAIKEAARLSAQNTPNPAMAEHFEHSIARGVRSLRAAGLDTIADAVAELRAPLADHLREGR